MSEEFRLLAELSVGDVSFNVLKNDWSIFQLCYDTMGIFLQQCAMLCGERLAFP